MKMKRIFAAITAIAIVLTMIPVTVVAATSNTNTINLQNLTGVPNTQSEGWGWWVSDNVFTVVSGNVNISGTVDRNITINIQSGATLTVPSGQTLTVKAGFTLTVSGAAVVNSGTITVEAFADFNGLPPEGNALNVIAHIPVESITNLPGTATAGTNLTLPAAPNLTVTSANNHYTIADIIWAIAPLGEGGTGATLTSGGTVLQTNSAGTVQMTATILRGRADGTDFVQEFTIQVNATTTNITSVAIALPAPATFGDVVRSLNLPSGTNFTASPVRWSITVANNETAFTAQNFEGNTVYTATVTLTPNDGFAFPSTGLTAALGGQTAAIRRDGANIDISRTFPVTRAATSLQTTPRNLKAEPGNERVVLTWEAPENPSGNTASAVIRYQYSFGPTAGYANSVRNWIDIPNSNVNTRTFTITGLSNDVDYSFQIRAVNQHGGGVASAAITSTPIGTATVPQNFRVSPGNANVMLSWTAPAFAGGTIVGFEYSFGPTGSYSENWDEIPNSGANTTSFILDNLSNGTTYRFQVRAVNLNGEGVATATLDATPDTNVLSAPRNFSAVAGDGQITLTWVAPQSTGGSTITKYQYSSLTTAGAPTWRDIPDSGADTTAYTITGLTNGTPHFIEIRAVNANRDGATSGVRISTPFVIGATNTAAVDSRTSDIQSAASDDNGRNVTINMGSSSNAISTSVLDIIKNKNVSLILDYGATGKITVNGRAINAENGTANLNLNLQRSAATTTMLADYTIPKAAIDGVSPLPAQQLKIGSGASVAVEGTVLVNLDTVNAGRNAILARFNSTANQFEIAGTAVIAANGEATIPFDRTGDYVVIIQKTGDVNGDNKVDTADALEALRKAIGIVDFDPFQMHVVNTRRDETVTTADALQILRFAVGLINSI